MGRWFENAPPLVIEAVETDARRLGVGPTQCRQSSGEISAIRLLQSGESPLVLLLEPSRPVSAWWTYPHEVPSAPHQRLQRAPLGERSEKALVDESEMQRVPEGI